MKKIATIFLISVILLIFNFPFSFSTTTEYNLVKASYSNFNQIFDSIDLDNINKREIEYNTLASNLILINKEKSLPADYVPEDLVLPDIPFSFEG